MSFHKVKIPAMRYLSYAVFVQIKKMIGLGEGRNRKFLVWKLAKLINGGFIDVKNISVTSTGKNDGVGAQAMAKFSAMCFAKAYDIEYVHAPFVSLAHAEEPIEAWTQSWEQLLNMNIGDCLLDEESMRVVKLEEYLNDRSIWMQKVVVSDLHFHAICQLMPSLGTFVSRKLQNAIEQKVYDHKDNQELIIGVHVRLGDVRKGDSDTGHRYIKNNHIVSVLGQVLEVVSGLGYNPKIHIHTNGSSDEVQEFSIFKDVEYHANASAIQTFIDLVQSDVIITARSDFSMLAGIYSKGIVICDPRHRTPLNEWIKVVPGSVNVKKQLESDLKNKIPS